MLYINLIVLLAPSIYGIGQPHYECGEHGRFEYCIDGVPGCIVGCHCHPGYYFDTDTKICEPNAKLVHEYRRLYEGVSPTRVPYTPFANEPEPETASTPVPAEPEVGNAAKDTDDLGDWLYNQFFKTIESQVINGTVTDKPQPSRRNEENFRKLRKRYKPKHYSKKSRRKKTNLRRKLLRITEDDSMFDSSSGSSEESSESSSSDESSSDSSDESREKNDASHKDDKNHGHRKILMVNKKPKAPLPSFIFLPNLGSPFFQPVGLPAPMYPMVPVPPMPVPAGPPMPPLPAPIPDKCKSSEQKDKDKSRELDKKDEKKRRHCVGKACTDPGTLRTETIPEHKYDGNTKNGGDEENDEEHSATKKEAEIFKNNQRNKMLRQLMKKQMHQMRATAELDPFMDDDVHFRTFESKPTANDGPPNTPKVDFKYLSQLIHKMGNKTKPDMPIPRPKMRFPKPTRRLETYPEGHLDFEDPNQQTIPNGVTGRRILENPEDSYYSNLGHQIASIIRTIDINGDPRVNIEIERDKSVKPFHKSSSSGIEHSPYNLDHSTPRSYWERSVRSLLNNYQMNDDEYQNYRQTAQEQNLLKLERRVETIATTHRPMSLHDLENVIAFIDQAKQRFKTSTERTEMKTLNAQIILTTTDDKSLNVNLLPHKDERPKTQVELYEYEKSSRNYENAQNHGEILNPKAVEKSAQKKLNENLSTVPLEYATYNENMSSFDSKKPSQLVSRRQKHLILKNSTKYALKNMKKQKANLMYLTNVTVLNDNQMANVNRVVSARLKEMGNIKPQLPKMPWLGPKIRNILNERVNRIYNSAGQSQTYNLKDKVYSESHKPYLGRNYVENSKQKYYQNEIPPLPRKPLYHETQPSAYFHHELQHFDMFEI